mmetsp:Transcript_5938/g.15492  ORF Transcript_5938/g.15492 Transcript_5938/m.15492 type:complete len:228 (+) Transcript_5938:62-745(+)
MIPIATQVLVARHTDQHHSHHSRGADRARAHLSLHTHTQAVPRPALPKAPRNVSTAYHGSHHASCNLSVVTSGSSLLVPPISFHSARNVQCDAGRRAAMHTRDTMRFHVRATAPSTGAAPLLHARFRRRAAHADQLGGAVDGRRSGRPPTPSVSSRRVPRRVPTACPLRVAGRSIPTAAGRTAARGRACTRSARSRHSRRRRRGGPPCRDGRRAPRAGCARDPTGSL